MYIQTEILKSMITTEASLSYQLPERYWQNSINRLNVNLNLAGLIPKSQWGFRKDIGTLDIMARQLQEKCQDPNVDLCMTFVDLTKAFDRVSHDGLWKIVAKFGCK